MSLSDLKFLSGFGNGNLPEAEILELPEITGGPVKSDFFVTAPVMKVDKLVLNAETDLLRRLVSFQSNAKGNVPQALDTIKIDKDYNSLTRSGIPDISYSLKSDLETAGLTATIGTVSARFRRSSIDNNFRYLISNEAIYSYCLAKAYFEDLVQDADGLYSRVMVHAKKIREYLNKKMADSFFKKNRLDKRNKDIPYKAFVDKAAVEPIPFVSGQSDLAFQSILRKLLKYDGLPRLVEKYVLKGEVDPENITPDIQNKMVEHLTKMGVKVTVAQADAAGAKYDEYLALAYSHARRLSGGVNDPLKNLFSDVAVDTFDYKVDYFETIEEQSIDRSHILGAAVLFYTKVLSDDMGLLRIADAIIMAWTQGKLDIPHGETATKLYRYYKLRKERMTSEERSMFYKIVFNTGSAEVLENSVVNNDFPKLWGSLMQETVKYIQKYEENDNAEDFVSKVGIYNSIKNLQYNISVFMTGMIKSLLPEMYAQLQNAIEIVKQPEVVSQLGQGYQRNMWKVVERIGAEVFNAVPNVSALKTIAIKGHSIFSAIAAFDEAQFSEEAFRKFITDIEEFIVAQGQLEGKVLGAGEDEEEEEEDEEEYADTRVSRRKKSDDWDF